MNFKTFFSEQARKPSGLFGRWVMARIFDLGNAALNDFMKELISLKENDHVLEIGFGTGKLIFNMAKQVKKGVIEGIDLSDTMVAIAEKKNKKYIAQGRVIIRQGNFAETAYGHNRFDKICSANTVYFWPQPDNYIKKILRILKPGGKLILAFEDINQLESRQLNTTVFHFYHQDEIVTLLSRNGFSRSIEVVSKEKRSLRYHCAVAVK
ncbi:MAG: class I SAM-dependent methyltransferase [Desulfobacterales bacterium]|jgi:ubiquinone/menaquinone biosynthesis C-methylase UbiE